MIALNYSKFRENLKTYMDRVTEDYETLIVTRKTKNVVVISEEAYNNLLENLYVLSDKANYDWLMESIAQAESGKTQPHDLIGEDDD